MVVVANPFVDTQAFRGLIVAQMVLNSWDLKTANNRLYEATDRSSHRAACSWSAMSARHSATRNRGGSLRSSKLPDSQGSKNDLEGFERQGFIKKVNGNRVEFDYRGRNR